MLNADVIAKTETGHYQLLSSLLDFPNEAFAEKINLIQSYLDEHHPPLGNLLKGFSEFSLRASLDELQELYTRTFEVQAVTTLDLGYLLFGDDYKRAKLLVNLNREHTLANNDCGHELSDHLPNVLRLLSKLKDEDLKNELVRKMICPGLAKIVKEFDPESLAKKNEVYLRHHKTLIEMPLHVGTIYQKPIHVLLSLLLSDFGIDEVSEDKSNGFLGAIGNEMNIEG